MKTLSTVLWTSMSIAAVGVVGCNRTTEVTNPPATAQEPAAPAAVAAPGAVAVDQDVAQEAPPPPVVEVQTVSPGPDYEWVGGYWNWDNRHYVWVGGHYSHPPEPGVGWVAPHYDHDAHGYHLTPGQWARRDEHDAHPTERAPERPAERGPDHR